MSCLWMSLSLLFVLQHSVSSDEDVKVNCPQTVEVKAGDSATINCSIKCNGIYCNGISFNWSDTREPDLCENTNSYKCEWDNRTYVSLTILKAMTDETVRVNVFLICGLHDNSTQIKIQASSEKIKSPSDDTGSWTIVKPVMISVFSVIIIVGILFFLYRTKKFSKTASHQAVNQEENSSSGEV